MLLRALLTSVLLLLCRGQQLDLTSLQACCGPAHPGGWSLEEVRGGVALRSETRPSCLRVSPVLLQAGTRLRLQLLRREPSLSVRVSVSTNGSDSWEWLRLQEEGGWEDSWLEVTRSMPHDRTLDGEVEVELVSNMSISLLSMTFLHINVSDSTTSLNFSDTFYNLSDSINSTDTLHNVSDIRPPRTLNTYTNLPSLTCPAAAAAENKPAKVNVLRAWAVLLAAVVGVLGACLLLVVGTACWWLLAARTPHPPPFVLPRLRVVRASGEFGSRVSIVAAREKR